MMMIFVINVFRRQGCPHLGRGHGPIVSSRLVASQQRNRRVIHANKYKCGVFWVVNVYRFFIKFFLSIAFLYEVIISFDLNSC